MTPVPVSVSKILHKNSPLAIVPTSLSLFYLWYVLHLLVVFLFACSAFSISWFVFCKSPAIQSTLLSALLCSANLPFVLWGEPRNQGSTLRLYFVVTHCSHEYTLPLWVDYTLLHVVHMSVHCELILRCCTSSIHFASCTKCTTWISNSEQHGRKGSYVNINFKNNSSKKGGSCCVLLLTLVFGKCATICTRLDRHSRGKTSCTKKYVISNSAIQSINNFINFKLFQAKLVSR